MIAVLFVTYPNTYTLNGTDLRNNSYVVDFSALPGEPFTGFSRQLPECTGMDRCRFVDAHTDRPV